MFKIAKNFFKWWKVLKNNFGKFILNKNKNSSNFLIFKINFEKYSTNQNSIVDCISIQFQIKQF